MIENQSTIILRRKKLFRQRLSCSANAETETLSLIYMLSSLQLCFPINSCTYHVKKSMEDGNGNGDLHKRQQETSPND